MGGSKRGGGITLMLALGVSGGRSHPMGSDIKEYIKRSIKCVKKQKNEYTHSRHSEFYKRHEFLW